MEKKEGFITAKSQKMLALYTTHTPNFLGLQQNGSVWQEFNYDRGVIIGLLDSRITPDHHSFHDNNMPPPPAKWKERCEFTGSVTCNNKLIGARHLLGGGLSDLPFDYTGHGTHISSMTAGKFVDRANIFGNANGTSAGMAPLAHIAMYKVCAEDGCEEADMLAAIEAAIHDGVDVISVSISGFHRNFHEDYIVVGCFATMRNGIIVVTSARGKIVVCDSDKKTPNYYGQALKDAGGVTMIFVNPKDWRHFQNCSLLPATIVGYAAGEKIKGYVTSSSIASAGIVFKGTKIGFKDAPSVELFS
ncbi:hypothetical protein BC332_16205 [Capsicum chinense]|nr:hypothetical protein BC332_16205 [Capsicum chinense]